MDPRAPQAPPRSRSKARWSHSIASNDRPALEHLLLSGLPFGIIDSERQSGINHHGQVCIVLEADGEAGKVGSALNSTFSTVRPLTPGNSISREGPCVRSSRALRAFGSVLLQGL